MKAKIFGNSKIKGNVTVGGAKNAALPIIASSILADEEVQIGNVPDLLDVREMIGLVQTAGFKTSYEENVLTVEGSNLNWDLSRNPSKIRASVVLLGPMALKTGKCRLPHPGGCAIGRRPIDIHIDGLKKLGFEVTETDEFIEATFGGGGSNSRINLEFPSVGATEHLMITAALMNGKTTIIENCAREPEIADLQGFLNSLGTEVHGAGTGRIEITGVKKTHSSVYRIIGDRIETGTYMLAAMMTNGRLKIEGIEPTVLNFAKILKKAGTVISSDRKSITVEGSGKMPFEISTGPYPGFPTDLQPQMTVLACTIEGISRITENIFENRFGHVEGLKKMGAKIEIKDRMLEITGGSKLRGTHLVAKDLRNAASLTFAASIADGVSEIENFEILFRGYEKALEKLDSMGIRVEI